MITNHIIESFLKCPYKAYQFFHNEQGKSTEYERLGEELLDMYRADFYAQLHARYDESQLLRGVRFEKKLAITDTTYVLEPVFLSEEVQIRFDALEITPHKELPSKLVYLPIEVIPNEKISKIDKLTLVVKCLLLTQAQRRVTPEFGKIVYGRALNSTKVKLAVYAKEARKVIKDLTKMLQSNDPPRFFQINECRTCQFQEDCQAKLVEKDDLSLLAGMGPKDVLKQNNRGIFTVLQFSYTFRPRRRSKKAANKPLRFEPALKALALREKKTYIQELPKLPETDVEAYLDFEGLPDENFIYLIGLMIKHGDTERQFSFWADTKEDEEAIFVQLFETLAPFDNFTVYHYGSYETQALKRLNRKCDNRYKDEVNWMLEKSVNILSFFSSTIYPPTYTNELKDIARFLGFRWSEQEASGIQSIVWRKRWELSQEVEYKKKLVQYNVEDCEALYLMKKWLTTIKDSLSNTGNTEFAMSSDLRRSMNYYKWGKVTFLIPEFEEINQCAYFDYQRNKVYLRTNQNVKKAIRKAKECSKYINEVDEILNHLPVKCPNCHHNTFYQLDNRKKLILNLKFLENGLKRWNVQLPASSFQCFICGEEFSLHRYGRNLVIWSINQYVAYLTSIPKIQRMILENFNIYIHDSAMFLFKTHLAKEYQSTYEEIKHILIAGNLLHTDETKTAVRENSKAHVWVFASMDAVYYFYRPSREANFLKDLLQEFQGVLVSDYYSGYDSLPCQQQKCLVHLIRDLNDDLLNNQFNTEYKDIVIQFGKLLRTIIKTVDTHGLKKRYLSEHIADVERFYAQILNKEYETKLAISWQKRFRKNKEKLFNFLNYDGIPWNNNNAENAIKPVAKYRAHAKGILTEKGVKSFLVLLSIQQTCKFRGINFLDFLKSGEKSIEKYCQGH